MPDPTIPAPALLAALASLGPCVVLRNQDVLASLAAGGDVDLLVPDRRAAERRLVAELGPPLYAARRSYVTGLYYDWGHVDLLPNLEWRGARYLDPARVLADRRTASSGLPAPRPAHEALVCWFSSLLWGGFVKERYRQLIVEASRQDGDELARVLRDAVGRRWGRRLAEWAAQGRPEESVASVAALRRATVRRALTRAPLRTARDGLRFLLAELRMRLNPPLPWVAVLGPDGSGKSTLLAALGDTWPRALGGVHVHHLRPHRLDRPGAPSGPVVDPHGRPPRAALPSAAALGFVLLDWWVGYWSRIVRERAKHGLVIFDRHLLDVLVDPLRYRYGGPAWLARAACALVPRPDVVVILDAPAAVVRARKTEVPLAESVRQCEAYRRLARDVSGAHLVDATQRPDQVLDAVTGILRRRLRG